MHAHQRSCNVFLTYPRCDGHIVCTWCMIHKYPCVFRIPMCVFVLVVLLFYSCFCCVFVLVFLFLHAMCVCVFMHPPPSPPLHMQADAVVSENGGRIWLLDDTFPTACGLREDLEWRHTHAATSRSRLWLQLILVCTGMGDM